MNFLRKRKERIIPIENPTDTFFKGHYIEWRKARIETIKKYVDINFFKNKTLLELGCGYADLGNEFYNLGSIVTSSDIRLEHLDKVKTRFPHLKTLVFDCDKDILETKYDIILHWGVLYHLNNIDKHLKNVLEKCDVLFLETEVCDSDTSCILHGEESGYDQAFNSIGSRPSQKYIEDILLENKWKFKLILDKTLNVEFHNYTWDITNTCKYVSGLRRFWICQKDSFNPCIIMKDSL